MSEQEQDSQVSEVDNLEDADEPISPGDSVAANPKDPVDLDSVGPDSVPERNAEENEHTDEALG